METMNVRDKIESGYYKVQAPYPSRYSNRHCPECSSPIKQESKFCFACGHHVYYHLKEIEEKYIQERHNYYKELRQKTQQFREDALEEVNLLNHPKRDKVFEYAWEEGHYAGFQEVLTHLEEISELLED